MCFNEDVSWITFIGGILLNMICFFLLKKYNPMDIAARVIVFQSCYPLLMQLTEAMVWRNQSSATWGQIAYMLNITQPHFCLAPCVYLLYKRVYFSHKGWLRVVRFFSMWSSALVCLLYTALAIIHNPTCDYEMIFPNCTHLQLSWWNNPNCMSMDRTWALPAYWISCCLAYAGMPFAWSILLLVLYLGTMFVSVGLYPCGIGSMWCWMVVTWAPVTTVVSFVLKHFTNFKPIVGIKFETICADGVIVRERNGKEQNEGRVKSSEIEIMDGYGYGSETEIAASPKSGLATRNVPGLQQVELNNS
jgi:hypothetical protein